MIDTWLDTNSSLLLPVLAGASALFLLLAVLFLLLWTHASRRRRIEQRERFEAERDLLDCELELAEQTARMRMVRELHEVAIHSVSVIISQADGARYKGESDPSAVVRSANVIADAARATLADMRRVMSIVKQGEADASPQPGIKTARDLFKVMRESGLEITFDETGSRFALKPGAELAVYRILQESLSNALKYGGEGTSVKVSFKWSEEGLNLLVDDDGVRASTRRAGQDPNAISRQGGYTIEDDAAALTSLIGGPGITEMRERTELFGGVFNAYSVPGVGFSISAAFPALRYDNGVHGVNLRRD